ncbi:hypothetical protein HCN51_20070 [Nonomuraea sp. FMUSA5-5]|uniref:Outer membrane channel protein CpnT-like N-terminal domain-containing protein n=1 Tax=Nonomuraea composti TaxID=2720023 RepID=A0ABX1B4I4_9ACTN|nr:hypothetical protein [Nonomuraea sp. FMUSA5-5]NJP91727.1 hypothetical protein [Nonomuraea sp. FMUSA5-5]
MAHSGDIGVRTNVAVSAQQEVVVIDSDVQPVWETEALPDWVVYWLIPMLSAGQKWPDASESGLSGLARAYAVLCDDCIKSAEPAGSAARVIVAGWAAPATTEFVNRARQLYGTESGIVGVSRNARAYAQQANTFAVETQYSKLSINVAFWVTVVAIAIAIIVAFFSAGASAALIGPYAAGARTAISRILVRLATLAGREMGAARLARVAALSGATGRGLLVRLMASPFGRELVEEIGEEFFIDFWAQKQQKDMGTREDFDWRQLAATSIGAAGGAGAGTVLAGPVSRVTRVVPGFTGRALTTGLTNVFASPAGSFLGNGLVYGQWQNPFTAESMMGAFMGGVGRTGSISPFNPEVVSALAHPLSTLAAAHDAAARSDAARAGGSGPSTGPAGPATPDGSPTGPDGNQPGSGVRTPDRVIIPSPRTSGTPALAGAGSQSASGRPGGLPDGDLSTRRRTSSPDQPAATPDQDQDRTQDEETPAARPAAATGPDPAAPSTRQAPSDTTARTDEDGTTAQLPDSDDQDTTATPPQAATTPQGDTSQGNGTQGNGIQDNGTQDNASQGDTTPQGDATSQGDATQNDAPQGDPAQGEATQSDATPQAGNDTRNQASSPTADTTTDTTTEPAQTTSTQDAAPSPTTPTVTAATGPAPLRARAALLEALGTTFPDAVISPTGEVLIPRPGGHRVLSNATMTRIRRTLDARAARTGAQPELVVDASALLLLAASDDTLSSDAPITEPPAAHTSKPGTVTSPPIAGTRYVTDSGRPTDVTLDEIKQATADLLTDHFQHAGERVVALSWAGDVLTVTTENGTHHFRPVLGDRGQKVMAETTLKAGTSTEPHEVSFAPRIATDQLPRVWLHEITDTMQHRAAEGRGRRQGVLRRMLPGGTTHPTGDECVPARLNELAYLTDKWEQAQTVPEQRLLALDIDGVLHDLRARGATPPPPPWANGPQSERTGLRTVALGQDPSPEDARELARRLEAAQKALKKLADSKRASAKQAGKEAREARKEAEKAGKEHDSGAALRADTAEAKARSLRDKQARHKRIAAAYSAAHKAASQARQAHERYARLLAALPQAPAQAPPGQLAVAALAERAADEAAAAHRQYLEALDRALPDTFSLPESMPTGRLAHLDRLTDAVNEALKGKNVAKRFTPDELENFIRGDFHKVVSGDGLVLNVGHGKTAAELRLKLTLADLVEVADPAVKASQVTVGMFYQTGQTYTATQSGSAGTSGDFNSGVLAPLVPDGTWARAAADTVAVGVGASAGRSWSASGGSSMFEQGGSVADNRSESLLFDATATWTVELRTGKAGQWQHAATVDSGSPGDTATQRIWVWHSYADRTSRDPIRIDAGKESPKPPNQEVISMTGLEEALDAIAAELGGDYTRIGTNARRDLRKFVTHEVQARFRRTLEDGLPVTLAVDGEPDVRITATSEIVHGETRMVGAVTPEALEEEVLTETATSPSRTEHGGSIEGKVSAGFNVESLQGADIFGPLGDYHPDSVRPEVKGSRPVAQSSSSTANEAAVHPQVDKRTGLSQAYQKVAKVTFTVERPGKKPKKLGPFDTELLLRQQVLDAFHAGDPVPKSALVLVNGKPKLDADGNPVLNDVPRRKPVKGRKMELPQWLGDGAQQMRGAGPTDVREVTGLEGLKEHVLDKLAHHGLVAKSVDGVRRYSRNPLIHAAQLFNEEEVEAHLVESAIRSGLDQMAQSGVLIPLQMHGVNATPDVYALQIVVRQDFSGRGTPKGLVNKVRTHLDIASDTSGRGINRSRTYGGGGSAVKTDGPGEGHDGVSHKAGPNAGGDRTYSAGTSTSSMVNKVGMEEDGKEKVTAGLETKATVEVNLVHNGKVQKLVKPRSVRVLMMVPGDMLPRDGGPDFTGPMGRPSKRLMEAATLEHFDGGRELGDIKGIWRLLPRSLRGKVAPLVQLWPVLSRHFLASHLFEGPITHDLVLDPNGPVPARTSLEVRGELGEATFVDVVDSVTGRIMLALRSAGISWGGSNNIAFGLMNSLADADDGGTTSDSGSLSLPSRSRVRALATALLAIWGTEFLGISVARKYRFQVPVDVLVKLRASRATPIGQQLDGWKGGQLRSHGNGLFTVPEHDALRLYAEGDVTLPVPVVADAVERFLNGAMKLHRTLAVPLVMRYVQARAEALARGENVGIGREHTPDKLLQALGKVADLGPAVAPAVAAATAAPDTAGARLDEALDAATALNEQLNDVVIAPQYEHGMGTSMPQSFVVTDGQGNEVDVMEEVLSAIDTAVPGAEDGTPNLRRQIRADLNGTRPQVHIDEMWSRRGLEREYDVQTGPDVDSVQVVTVRVRLEHAPGADPRRARLVDHTDENGVIIQRYRAKEASHTESYSGAYSAGLDFSDDSGEETKGGLSTKRTRSFSSSVNENRMRLQRMARFKGESTVEQDMRLVIEIETRPARVRPVPFERRVPGAAAKVRSATAWMRRRRTPAVTREYDVKLRRGLPGDMVRSAAEDPGPVPAVTDPRQAEFEPGHFPEVLIEDETRPTLFDAISRQLSRMIGHAAVAERAGALSAWLSHSGLITGLERSAGRDGDVVPHTVQPAFRNQGVDVTVKARMSDLTVVAGPYEGEKGEVDRRADAQNLSVSRGHVQPVGMSAGSGFKALGFSFSSWFGAQSSQSAGAHQGARRERSMFETGKLYTVRVRVDYDLTFERVKRHRGGDVRPRKEVVRVPGASGGTAMIALFGEELEELHARMEAGVHIAPPLEGLPTFAFHPQPGRSSFVQVMQDARVAARERREVARFHLYEEGPNGEPVLHRYLATPDGFVHSVTPDGGFAQAFATLPPPILEAADQHDLNLRDIFMNSPVAGTFTQQVAAELEDRNALPPPQEPIWQVAEESAANASPGSSTFQGTGSGTGQGTGPATGQGSGAPSVTAPELPGSPLAASARPDGMPDLTTDELRAQDVSPADFGGAVASLRWSGDDRLVIQLPGAADQHVRVLPEDPGAGLVGRTELNAGTPENPHVMRIGPRVDPHVVSSVLVHEISHIAQEHAAQAAGVRQGLVRESLSPAREGTDHCLTPRLDEHAHLARKWRASTDPQARERIAAAIDAVAADIPRRGHTPPAPPWHARPPASPAPAPAARSMPGLPDPATVARLRGLIDALNGDGAAPRSAAPGSLAAALNGGPVGTRDLTAAIRAEAEKAGLAPGRPGAAARIVALARAGELAPEHVAALRGRPALPEVAAADAVARTAALMGARARTYGPGLLDIEIPGRAPIPVEIRPAHRTGQPDGGMLTYRVDETRTIGANERAAAATAAAGLAAAVGLPPAEHAAVAGLFEAVRQVRAATPAQHPARLAVLYDVAAAVPRRLVPAPLAADLSRLLAEPRPGRRHAYWTRARKLADGTGWQPPEDDEECGCPEDGPCVCGRRRAADPGRDPSADAGRHVFQA